METVLAAPEDQRQEEPHGARSPSGTMAAMLQSSTFLSWTMNLLHVCAEPIQMQTIMGPSKEQPRYLVAVVLLRVPQKQKEPAKPSPITQPDFAWS